VERAVLASARKGRALKWIAAELGISNAGASTHLQAGLAKLGLKHRLELQRLT
jgi:DNA-binding CsgD family transcriptional regulator